MDWVERSTRMQNKPLTFFLDFSLLCIANLGCFPTPTRRKKSFLLAHVLGVLKKCFWRSVWLPTPLEDVPRTVVTIRLSPVLIADLQKMAVAEYSALSLQETADSAQYE